MGQTTRPGEIRGNQRDWYRTEVVEIKNGCESSELTVRNRDLKVSRWEIQDEVGFESWMEWAVVVGLLSNLFIDNSNGPRSLLDGWSRPHCWSDFGQSLFDSEISSDIYSLFLPWPTLLVLLDSSLSYFDGKDLSEDLRRQKKKWRGYFEKKR